MGNIITYVEEYGGKTFEEVPFQETDSLIFCELSYLNFSGSSFVRRDFSCTIRDWYESEYRDDAADGLFSPEKDQKLLALLAVSKRFGPVRGGFFTASTNTNTQEQFAAITFRIDDHHSYIAFRGTDNSLVGWKEDLNLAFLDELPSQISAKNYTELVMNELSDTFYLGGHSKGGNLAVYAAMHVPDYIQDGIAAIFNHDGPGFLPQVYTSHEFLTIRKRIRKTVPQSAFVGLILEQHSDYTVVKSDAFSVLQHDPYSWVIENGAFVKIASIDTVSRYTNQALSHWIYSLDPETRRQFVDTLYDLLGGNGMGRMDALTEVPSQTILRMIRKLMLLPSDDRKLVLDTIRALVSAAFGEMRQFFSDGQMQLWSMLNTLADRLPLR